MNNLHRELAPISDAAWASIEEETTRTLKRHLAGRRVVDVHNSGGVSLSAVGTGHLKTIAAPGDGILARQREVKALVEFRVPFELNRQQIDNVERGANDSDWQPAKDAAQKIAFAEDRAIFEVTPRPTSSASARAPVIRPKHCRPMCGTILTPLLKRWGNSVSSASMDPIRCCSAPMLTQPSPRPATAATPCWNTSRSSSKTRSSGLLP